MKNVSVTEHPEAITTISFPSIYPSTTAQLNEEGNSISANLGSMPGLLPLKKDTSFNSTSRVSPLAWHTPIVTRTIKHLGPGCGQHFITHKLNENEEIKLSGHQQLTSSLDKLNDANVNAIINATNLSNKYLNEQTNRTEKEHVSPITMLQSIDSLTNLSEYEQLRDPILLETSYQMKRKSSGNYGLTDSKIPRFGYSKLLNTMDDLNSSFSSSETTMSAKNDVSTTVASFSSSPIYGSEHIFGDL